MTPVPVEVVRNIRSAACKLINSLKSSFTKLITLHNIIFLK